MAMTEAMYEIPEFMVQECRARLPEDMKAVLDRFTAMKHQGKADSFISG